MTAILEACSPRIERRQFPRQPCLQPAICRRKWENWLYALAVNLSCSGMAAQIWTPFEQGTSAYIDLRGADWSAVPIIGRVVRVKKYGTGFLTAFQFERLLSESEVSSYLGSK
jgi:hypothetical protein